MTEKIHIKVASEITSKKVGKYEVFLFRGEDQVSYETWSAKLADFIKGNLEFEADVEHSEKSDKDGNIYKHHKITQVYKDGEAVMQAKPQYGGFHKSSDSSIESQVAAKEIGMCFREGKLAETTDAVQAYIRWCSQRLSFVAPIKAEAGTQPKAKDSQGTEPLEFKNVGQLLTECAKHTNAEGEKITRQMVCDFIGVANPAEIIDLQEAWRMIQHGLIRVKD